MPDTIITSFDLKQSFNQDRICRNTNENRKSNPNVFNPLKALQSMTGVAAHTVTLQVSHPNCKSFRLGTAEMRNESMLRI